MNLLKPGFSRVFGRASRFSTPFPLRRLSSNPIRPPRQEHLEREYHEEETSRYRPGGFHRVSLGDTFNANRYTVLRKLGFGNSSTVWLARDAKRQRYVALKILSAACYGASLDVFEREILTKISAVSRSSAHPGRGHTPRLLDEFTHAGPNGDHVCLVFDVLGAHLCMQVVQHEDWRLPVKVVKEIARQLLQALDFLHRECGVIHAGLVFPEGRRVARVLMRDGTDIKPANMLLELGTAPERTISEYLDSWAPRTTECEDAIPLQEFVTWPVSSEMGSLRINLIDFGLSCWRHKHRTDVVQPVALRAPEVIVGAPWDTGVDIWSLGCLVVEFLHAIVLFYGGAPAGASWSDEDQHLARMVGMCGAFPPSLLQQGRRSAEFFNEQGRLTRSSHLDCPSLEQILDHLSPSDMSRAEVGALINFVKAMLTIDPALRKSAQELLRHEWLA